MARIVILGGGFGGVVAAESLVKLLPGEHQITLISRSNRFLFYPALVRLAFGQCQPEDISFDLRGSMLDRRINFIEAEVAYVAPDESLVVTAHGEVEGNVSFDYLIFALGRRLATERVAGFFEHGHHLLDLNKTLKFGEAVRTFREGRIVLGQCPGARLPIPVYETAFASSRAFTENENRERIAITIVSPENLESEFRDEKMAARLGQSLEKEQIEYVPNFAVKQIESNSLIATDSRELNYDLLMLLPPFKGSSAAARLGAIDADGYIKVDSTMKMVGQERIYAAGDCVNFDGPKLGHMAVRQAHVAAANVAAQITGEGAVAHYEHNLKMILEAGEGDSIYFQKDLWSNEPSSVRQGRFWRWAKRAHQKYWNATHS